MSKKLTKMNSCPGNEAYSTHLLKKSVFGMESATPLRENTIRRFTRSSRQPRMSPKNIVIFFPSPTRSPSWVFVLGGIGVVPQELSATVVGNGALVVADAVALLLGNKVYNGIHD